MAGDGGFEIGEARKGIGKVDRRQAVVAAEGEEIPVVVADAEAEPRLCASLGQQLDASAANALLLLPEGDLEPLLPPRSHPNAPLTVSGVRSGLGGPRATGTTGFPE